MWHRARLKIPPVILPNYDIMIDCISVTKIWAGHVARMGQGRRVYRVLVGKPEGKRPLGRPRHRWEDNIKMDLQEVGGIWVLDGVGSG